MGMRTMLMDDVPVGSAEHEHAEGETEQQGGHDDSALETQVEAIFSSKPTVFRLINPETNKVLLEVKEFEGTEWSGMVTMSLEGHLVELLIEVEWEATGQRNFVQVNLSPDSHATKQATLNSEENISSIAEFEW